MTPVARIARFSLTSADPATLARFYVDALGFTPVAVLQEEAEPYGVPGLATIHRLRLGAQEIELVGFEQQGAPYPEGSTSHDAWFQHLALVAPDMTAAHTRLARTPGWQTITRGGTPVQLPESSGGVIAFKFRDPEGHPLELLSFPADSTPASWRYVQGAGPCLGIDHSAIAVADGARSLAFYEALGLAVSARSLNQGPAQETLDAATGVAVDVTGLSFPDATPHLELLAYRTPSVRPGAIAPADVACTRSVMIAAQPAKAGRMLTDPDGHRILLVAG